MSDTAIKLTPFVRQEYERDVHVPASIAEVERELPFAERLWNAPWARRALILILLALIWESYARCPNVISDLLAMAWHGNFTGFPACSANPLLFPTFTDTMTAWWDGIVSEIGRAHV